MKKIKKTSLLKKKNFNKIFFRKIGVYFLVSIVLFLVAAVIGLLFPDLFRDELMGLIKQLIDQTEGLDAFGLIKFIFLNNTKSSFFAFIFGIFFGIVPVGILVVNGYLLGFVSNITIVEVGVFELWRLLPHGVFELSAIFLCTALGMNLGFRLLYNGIDYYDKKFSKPVALLLTFISLVLTLFFFVFSLVITMIDEKKKKEYLSEFYYSLIYFILVAVPLLIVAAIIEGVLIAAGV